MANIKIIAAIGKNLELGKDNDLIWHLKEDLKFFKEETMGHEIVMGYNTFKSLPGLLPGREHIVITRKDIEIPNVKVFNEIDSLRDYLDKKNNVVYIIGGASIYKLFIDIADELILTEIDAEAEADVFFPEFNKENYVRKVIKENEEKGIKYKHVSYRRVK